MVLLLMVMVLVLWLVEGELSETRVCHPKWLPKR